MEVLEINYKNNLVNILNSTDSSTKRGDPNENN